jgi:broad specificity phosphatase PhoE
MSATRVHLVRHGEVENPHGILYGRLPGYGLSARGHAMAQRLAEHFTTTRSDIAYLAASPMQRAQETIAPLADALDMAVLTDERVIEADSIFEGLDLAPNPGQLAHPRYWRHFFDPFTPSWGEPYREQVARMTAAIRSARAAADGRDAVIVSHQSPIWSTRRALEGRTFVHDPRSRECTLASVTTLTFDGTTLVGLDYAEPAADLLVGAVAIT